MRVLIFHGYLLRRDGLERLQRQPGGGAGAARPRGAPALPGARRRRAGVGRRRRRLGRRRAGARRAARAGARHGLPARLGGLLPVYVADRYEGIEASRSPTDDAEIDAYLERNVAAVREVAERARPDVALANHLVMGPAILARALGTASRTRSRSTASALEYTVKPHPERFLPVRARGPRAGARGVLVGSRHTAESLWAAMDDPGAAGAHPARAAGRRRRRVRAAGARGGAARGSRALRRAAAAPPRPRRSEAAPRSRRDPARRPPAALAAVGPGRPPRRLRRQADRLQGRRPAARGLAAGAARACPRRGS